MAKFKRNNLQLKTNQRILLGNLNQSQIRFDGTNLLLNSSASVQLFYNGLKSAATTALGLDVFDTDGNQPFIYFKRSNGAAAGNVNFSDGNFSIYDNINSNNIIYSTSGAGVRLFYNGVESLDTISGGIKINNEIDITTDGTGIVVVGDVHADYFIGDGSQLTNLPASSSNTISQGDSDVTVTDAGTGEVTSTVDGTEVLDLTASSQRLGISGVASNILISQSGDLIQMYSNGVRHYYQSPTEVLLGKANDTNIYILPDDNDIIVECNNVPVLNFSPSGISLDGETNYFNDTLVSTDSLDASSPDNALVSAKLVYESILASSPSQISQDDSYVKVVDDGTNAGYIEIVADGVQVSYWDAEAASIRLGKLSGAGNITITDTDITMQINSETALVATLNSSVELYHNNLLAAKTLSSGFDVIDPNGTDAYLWFHSSGEVLLGRIYSGTNYSAFTVGPDADEAIRMNVDGSIELYHNDVKTLETESTGIKIWNDSLVTSTRMYHSASSFFIDNERLDDNFWIRGYRTGSGTPKNLFYANVNGGCNLYYDGTQSLATEDGNIRVYSSSGGSSLRILHDETDAIFRNIRDDGGIKLQLEVATDTIKDVLVGVPGAATQLFFNGTRVFNTTADGIAIKDTAGDEPVLYFRDDSDGEKFRIAAYDTHIDIEGWDGTNWIDYALFSEDGIQLATGVAVNEISNNSTANLSTQLMTADAIQAAVEAETAGSYTHTQSIDSTEWIVVHNLGRQYVNVEVINSNNQTVIPDSITFDSDTTLTITFVDAKSGHAAVTAGGGEAVTSDQIFANNSFVKVVDDGTAAGYVEIVADGVQVAYWDAEATTIRLGKASSAGRVDISDTTVDLYHAGTKAMSTVASGSTYQGIQVGDNDEAALYHYNGTGTFLATANGDLFIDAQSSASGSQTISLRVDDAGVISNGIIINGGAECGFYYNGSHKFSTSAEGFKCIYTSPGGFVFSDQLGNDAITVHQGNAIELAYGGGKVLETRSDGISLHSIDEGEEAQIYVSPSTDDLVLTASATSGGIKLIGTDSADAAANMIICNPNGDVDLYHDNVNTFETSQFGANCIHASTPSLGLWEGDESQVVAWCWANSTDVYVQHDLTNGAVILQAKASTNSRLLTWDPANGGLYPTIENSYTCGVAANVWSDIYAQSGSVNTSDERAKTEITESSLGLDFIDALNPVSYKFKDYDWVDSQDQRDGTVIDSTGTHTFIRTHYGLIAQQVKQTMDSLGIDSTAFAGYIYNPEADYYGLRYHEFIAPMIKAIQELKATNEAQQTEIDAQQTQINDLISRVEALEGA